MKMKKNTTFNPKINNKILDFIVIIISLLIIFADVYLFIKNFNETFEKQGLPIAIISYKYKTVQRKFVDRAIWDRPLQNSFLYDGDTIRTAENSAASIHFLSGDETDSIDIDSNTIIQIFGKNEKSEINLNTGSISAKTTNNNLRLKSNGSELKLDKNSVLHITKKGENDLQVAVEKGSVSIEKKSDENNSQLDQPQNKTSQKILEAGEVLQEGEKNDIIMMSPTNNARFFNQNRKAKAVQVQFKWLSLLPAEEKLILETSPVANFSSNVKSIDVTGLNKIETEEDNSIIYWRIYTAKAGASAKPQASGRFTLHNIPAPNLLLPQANEKLMFFKNSPQVRFLWEGNKQAASYLIEVADNIEMNNPVFKKIVKTESITVSTFTEGSWYWRVKPLYSFDSYFEAQSSEVSFFHIEKTANAEKPAINLSREIIDTSKGESLTFSWKPSSDAVKYKIKITADKEMKKTLLEKEVKTTHIEIKNAAKTLPNGEYYVQIASINKDNEIIATSDLKSFKTVNNEFILHTVFPPQNYKLAKSLIHDTRFTWKSNLNTEIYFQVSDSEDFKKLIVNKSTKGLGVDGVSLPEGDLYWRISAEANGEKFTSDYKKLIVLPPLEKPSLIGVKENIIILPKHKNKFKWAAVEGADYYQVKITDTLKDSKPIYENLFTTTTEIEIDMRNLNDNSYILSIQPFAQANAKTSRRFGLAIRHNFVAKHLKSIELLNPINGKKINGIESIFGEITASWDAAQIPVNPEFILRKEGTKKPIINIKNASKTVKLPPLQAGTYLWKVNAFTEEGFDISAINYARFTVLPIPPLPKAKFISPINKASFGTSYFSSNRKVIFKWQKIPEATHYLIRIYNSTNKTIVKEEISGDSTSENIIYNFTELRRLARGTFFAEIIAQRRLENGEILQNGLISKIQFEIDLPKIKTIETDETGVLYGQ